MPLTDIQCRNATVKEKSYKMFDGGGLYLEVMPNKSKLWRLKYRYLGTEKRISFGAYPLIKLADARASRDEAKRLLAKDIDPSVAKSYKLIIKNEAGATVDTIYNTDSGLDEPYKEFLSGNGSQTVFTVSEDLGVDETALDIWIDDSGWYPVPDTDFTISGTTLTFDTAPASGTNNIYVTAPSLNLGSASSAAAAASNSKSYAEEWANKDEDSLISTDAGGDGASDYSARHWAAKAEGFAQDAEEITFNGISALGSGTPAEDDELVAVDVSDGDSPYKLTINDIIELIKETGDGEWTFRATPKTGYIFSQGQILGSTGSGADLEGDTFQDLYTFYWNNLADAQAPVSGGRGESAAADWAANKTLISPNAKDRAPFGVGNTWALGEVKGSDTIAQENLPDVTLSVTGTTNTTGNHSHSIPSAANSSGNPYVSMGNSNNGNLASTNSAGNHSHTVSGDTEAMGDGEVYLPKGIGMNYMVKL